MSVCAYYFGSCVCVSEFGCSAGRGVCFSGIMCVCSEKICSDRDHTGCVCARVCLCVCMRPCALQTSRALTLQSMWRTWRRNYPSVSLAISLSIYHLSIHPSSWWTDRDPSRVDWLSTASTRPEFTALIHMQSEQSHTHTLAHPHNKAKRTYTHREDTHIHTARYTCIHSRWRPTCTQWRHTSIKTV